VTDQPPLSKQELVQTFMQVPPFWLYQHFSTFYQE